MGNQMGMLVKAVMSANVYSNLSVTCCFEETPSDVICVVLSLLLLLVRYVPNVAI